MGFDPSYVSHVEGRRHRPTEDFARRAEAVLGAGGAIWQRFQEYDELRHARGGRPGAPRPAGAGAVDAARHRADRRAGDRLAGVPRRRLPVRIRRALYNAGTEPVTRYLVRIAVDRYPHDPARSNRHHRDHPLTFEELDLQAYCGEARRGEPMQWRAKQDRDAFKEVWLLFENDARPVPALPRRADHHRVRLHGQRGEVGAVVPARRPAADPPARRPPGLPGRRSTRRCGASRRRCPPEEVPLRTPVVRERRRRPGAASSGRPTRRR